MIPGGFAQRTRKLCQPGEGDAYRSPKTNGASRREHLRDRQRARTLWRRDADSRAALQRALVRAGIEVAVDGNFGEATEAAVKRYQSGKGLTADGIVGPATRAALGL
jgi:peptidoglycan hydrolase-like protein with peptidoglycan-binding domain